MFQDFQSITIKQFLKSHATTVITHNWSGQQNTAMVKQLMVYHTMELYTIKWIRCIYKMYVRKYSLYSWWEKQVMEQYLIWIYLHLNNKTCICAQIHKDPVIVVTSGEESGLQVGGDLHVYFLLSSINCVYGEHSIRFQGFFWFCFCYYLKSKLDK